MVEHKRELEKITMTSSTPLPPAFHAVRAQFLYHSRKTSAKYSSRTVPLQFPYSSRNSSHYEKPQFPYLSYYKEFQE